MLLAHHSNRAHTSCYLYLNPIPNMSDEEQKVQNSQHSQDLDHMEALNKFRSAASVAMTPELFEKLYLSPQNKIHGDLRKTFANPTPM